MARGETNEKERGHLVPTHNLFVALENIKEAAIPPLRDEVGNTSPAWDTRPVSDGQFLKDLENVRDLLSQDGYNGPTVYPCSPAEFELLTKGFAAWPMAFLGMNYYAPEGTLAVRRLFDDRDPREWGWTTERELSIRKGLCPRCGVRISRMDYDGRIQTMHCPRCRELVGMEEWIPVRGWRG